MQKSKDSQALRAHSTPHRLVGRVVGEAVTRRFVEDERRITPVGPAHGADPMGSNPPYELTEECHSTKLENRHARSTHRLDDVAVRFMNSERILFLHIPKTAGTSLKHYLFHRYAADQCLLDPTPQTLQQAVLDDHAFVAGHFDFDQVGRYRRPPAVLTCLRNPIDRAISAYCYQRTPRLRIQIQSISAQIGTGVAAEVLDDIRRLNDCGSLADFLRREPELAQKTLGNVQTRCLAGAKAASAHAHQPRQLLAIAKKNLQACAGILLTERMSESLARLDFLLGHDEFGALTEDNVTENRSSSAQLDPAVVAALAEITDLDLGLYSFAQELWQQRTRSLDGATERSPWLDDQLPDAADFAFDQPIRGQGWHIRERADHWYCWSDQVATLHLALDSTGPHILRFWVDHAASLEALHLLQVRVNGRLVSLMPTEAGCGFLVEARVPAEAFHHAPVGHVCVEFRVPQTVRPSDRDPTNPDTRRLGIALSRLQMSCATDEPDKTEAR
jgi:hypothetical protein